MALEIRGRTLPYNEVKPIVSIVGSENPAHSSPESEAPYQGSFFNVMQGLMPRSEFDRWKKTLFTIKVGQVNLFMWEENTSARCITVSDVNGANRMDEDAQLRKAKGGNHTFDETTEICGYRFTDGTWKKEREAWFDKKKQVRNVGHQDGMEIKNKLLENVLGAVIGSYSADIIPPQNVIPITGRTTRTFTDEERKRFSK